MQIALLTVFLLGYVLLATLGAWTKMAFQWPAYLVLAAGGLLSLLRLHKGFRFKASGLCLLSALLFSAYLAVRAWLSPVEYLARQDLVPLLASLIAYCTFALHVEHPKYRRYFILVVAGLIVANFGIGVYQSQHDRTWSPYTLIGYARASGEMNAGGFFHSENHLAGFLEGSMYFLLGFTLFARSGMVGRMLYLFGFILAGITLALTYSRGGVISAGVGLGAFVLLALVLYGRFLGPQFFKYLVAFGAMFAVLGGFLVFLCWSFLSDHYKTGILNQDQNLRYALWDIALEQWKMEPLWGTGAQTYEYHSRMLTRSPEQWSGAFDKSATFAHNDYLQLLADYGLVGAVLGGLFLLLHLGNGLRFLWWYRNTRYERTGDIFSNSLALGLGAVSALFAYMAHSVTDFNLHIPANAVLMAAVFGLLANPGFDGDARTLRLPGLKALLTVLSAVAGAWLLLKGFHAARGEFHYEKGMEALYAGEAMESLRHFERSSRLDPANYRTYLARGQAYAQLAEEYEEIASLSFRWRVKAAEQFELARELHPHFFMTYLLLAEQLSEMGGEDGLRWADQRYKEAIERAPSYREVWSSYGFHLLRSGRFAEAADVLEKALKIGWWDHEANFAASVVSKIREQEKASATGTPEAALEPEPTAGGDTPAPEETGSAEAVPPAATPPAGVETEEASAEPAPAASPAAAPEPPRRAVPPPPRSGLLPDRLGE